MQHYASTHETSEKKKKKKKKKRVACDVIAPPPPPLVRVHIYTRGWPSTFYPIAAGAAAAEAVRRRRRRKTNKTTRHDIRHKDDIRRVRAFLLCGVTVTLNCSSSSHTHTQTGDLTFFPPRPTAYSRADVLVVVVHLVVDG